jgi:hypothetical protein
VNKVINSNLDNKNIGLLKNLHLLRQELDVYCLISVNANSINKKGVGKSFFGFLQKSCIDLITLNICKIYEYEKQYELNSIEGVLKNITSEQLSALDSSHINCFIQKYDSPNEDEPLATLSSIVAGVKNKYQNELERFRTYRDKGVAHSESGFNPDDLPSYDVMEHLFNFGSDFYMLVSAAFVSTASASVVPCDLNSDRKVKVGLKRILHELGLTDIKTEME